MKVTILGCGTSVGVPTVGNNWGACDPSNPKNRRRRVSVAVEEGSTRLLIDTSPDLREQLLDARINHLDAVLYTHDHADHVHGIDDLRLISYGMKRKVPVYSNAETLAVIQARFPYIFKSQDNYPAICDAREVTTPFDLGSIAVTPFEQGHGNVNSLGYRLNQMAYSTDVNALDEAAFEALEGVELWVVDALRYEKHPTHAHLDLTLSWIERVKPKRAILTHMTHDMDYDTLKTQLPPGVEPAYDGMVLEV